MDILPTLSQEVGLQFSGKFIKYYFEEIELSDQYIAKKVLHVKVVSEIGSAGLWSRHVGLPFLPSNVNYQLREFKQFHYTEVFFWEETPPPLFIFEYNCWCLAAHRTDLIFDLSQNRNISFREYIDALDVRCDVCAKGVLLVIL